MFPVVLFFNCGSDNSAPGPPCACHAARAYADIIAEWDAPKQKRNLTPAMKQIVDVLTGQPARKALWIATKLGKPCGGSFRAMLSQMVRFDVLSRGEVGGYMLKNPEPQKENCYGHNNYSD